jgi:hypothetical protein
MDSSNSTWASGLDAIFKPLWMQCFLEGDDPISAFSDLRNWSSYSSQTYPR